MSKRTFARRVALFATSSLGLAVIASAVSVGVAAAPTPAAAQAVCVPAPTSGGGTNSVSYGGTLYSSGIDCDANGDMTVAVTTNGVDIGSIGVDMDAAGTDDITFNSTIEIDGNGLTGALINATTDSGTITINAAALDADQTSATNMTHGVLATSATGDIDINLTGTIDADASNNNLGGIAGIEARTGGDGDINITTSAGVHGRLYGILAETTGSGDLTIEFTGNGNPTTANIAGDEAFISATTGTGLLTIRSPNNIGNTGSRTGNALRISAGGDVDIDVASLRGAGGANAVLDMTTASGSQAAVNIGFISSPSGAAAHAIRLSGAGDVMLETGTGSGRVDFSAHTGSITWTITDEWEVGQTGSLDLTNNLTVPFAAGDDHIIVTPGAFFRPGPEGTLSSLQEGAVTLAFGAGDDTFSNAGTLVAGSSGGNDGPLLEADLRFENLETFENSGLILLGTNTTNDATDGSFDDVITMLGTAYIGSGDARIALDADLNGSQSACDVGLRKANFDMPGADCLNLSGGSTAGVTRLLVNDAIPGDRGGNTEIVLVDVSGGTSAAAHFVLDPASTNYSSEFGGVIDKGYFFYPLVYDGETQQHKLVGVAGQSPRQAPLVAQVTQELWRLSTNVWFERQADRHGLVDDGVDGGLWLRTTGEHATRDVAASATYAADTFDFDNSYSTNSYAVTGGIDLISGSDTRSAFSLGMMAGYLHSDMDFDASPNTARIDGFTGGLYASYLYDAFYLDAAVNANSLTIHQDIPSLNLFPEGTLVSSDLLSIGGQVEAGWRILLAENFAVEPFAGLSYVTASMDDVTAVAPDPARLGVVVEFDDPTSFRGAVGTRLRLDEDYGKLRVRYSMVGRLWNEFEDDTTVILNNVGDNLLLSDDFSGTFSEFAAGASISSDDSVVSGFFNFGGKFGDDYSSQNLSAGVRVNW